MTLRLFSGAGPKHKPVDIKGNRFYNEVKAKRFAFRKEG
jgi:hypothetical protein